jgi:ribosome recycling factor
MTIEKETEQGMKLAIEHLKQELKTLRSGRANPGMLDSVHVEVYGASMRLKELANVTVPEMRQLIVTPYDPNNVHAIAKAIETANLNIRPAVDGNVIRINIPPMDESQRKEIVKVAKKRVEETKVSIREVRRKGNDLVRKKKADGDIPEDQMKKSEKTIQEMTDKFCKEADQLFTEKEKEILSI